MTTQPATRQGDAPPRHLVARHRRRQAYEAANLTATRHDTWLTQWRAMHAAWDLLRAAVKRHPDSDAKARYVAAVLANLATDIDRRTP